MLNADRQEKLYEYLMGIYNLSPAAKEPYFSWSPCECCKSQLAGERYEFIGIVGKKHDGERVEIACCVDCFGYLFS